MENLIWLLPALPLFGFLLLAFLGSKFNREAIAFIGIGSVSLATIVSLYLAINFISSPPENGFISQTLWQWMQVNNFKVTITFHYDALSLVFVFVITFVGALIHLYSTEFMAHDEYYSRFFAYLNLFVCSMLILVLADNLVLLYLGWEGVGLCSYLLIGFWYKNIKNGIAAQKAFIITRIGDTSLAIGMFLLFKEFGTLTISEISQQAVSHSSSSITLIALLLFGGAVGKSAQLPLQTWLPDAMAGPSPVSALIHAATMVTAGVYLLARMHTIFELSPAAMHVVAAVGAATLLIAATSALAQKDIKRVLAYSTISQLGYMFLALGVGAWWAAIFHFMIHAFFKALLFLGAGTIIEAQHHEHNMFNMGGLKDKLPTVFKTFVIGSAALAALPLISAGFYSKDAIIWYSLTAQNGSPLLWLVAIIGSFITALYTTRMVVLTFYGTSKTSLSYQPGVRMHIPLIILAFLSVFAGFIELPHNFGHVTLFSGFVGKALPTTLLKIEPSESLFQLIAAIVCLVGILLGWKLYSSNREKVIDLESGGLFKFFFNGWYFDNLYKVLFQQPYFFLARINKNDIVDKSNDVIVGISSWLSNQLATSQTGSMRWYVMGIIAGAIMILTLQLVL
ncbi:NADH-quinone oxidoreductase subunit L [Solitalea sp. MAHUQ-68]|uniref:NADH-quinone oxidoreductase subunit L n=1 Tax=Solitalea agri TaxID=2953739 RepID=A0A9X2F0W3_9SPHI|nr:NADH-quinone oxidoreductase subunit L [Solitalea agri]MCO4292652.1 NADH-quinone oxidoreductase subunit L [Solitalea agri]